MTPKRIHVDRSALVRRAMIELVAENGFSGTSMTAVASRAGVATGTAYVHYASKDDLVVAAFREVKRGLGSAAVATYDKTVEPKDRFRQVWVAIYAYFAADVALARFLIQFESLPIAAAAHADYLAEEQDVLMETVMTEDVASQLVDLPLDVLFDLGIGPAVRLAAAGHVLDAAVLERTVSACWRAITIG